MRSPAASPALLARRLLATVALGATLGLAACGSGNDSPFAERPATEDQAGTGISQSSPDAVAPTAPVVTSAVPGTTGDGAATTPDGSVDGGDADTGTPPHDDNPAADVTAPPLSDSPSPAGTTPEAPPTKPKTLDQRIAADQAAMLNVRTMVSIVEGCHSGRQSYKDCNSQKDLGSADVLGLEVGKRRGQVRISASPNGFRVTATSFSGAKFTVARGPKGDRFKCIPGRKPGACPPNRIWSW